MLRAHVLVSLALSTACAGSASTAARDDTGVASSEDTSGGTGDDGGGPTGGSAGTNAEGSSAAHDGGPGDTDVEDGSSGDGAAPSCDDVCAIPPARWEGPVLLARAQDGPAACDDGTYALAQVTGYAGVQAAPASCACSCEVAAEIVCDDDVTLEVGAISCTPGQTQAIELSAGCSDIADLNAGSHYAIEVGYGGGACAVDESHGVLPPTYGEQFALCSTSAEAAGTCDGDSSCLPAPAAAAPLCWWAPGDLACPTGWDATRDVIYTEPVLDTRDCTSCVCDAPSGSCDHPGVVLVAANDGCNLAQVSPPPISVATGECVVADAQVQSVYAVAQATPHTECGVASEAEPMGEVSPQGPITVCCAA